MVGNNAFGQAPAQALEREFEMQCAERGRDGERAIADLVDGVALRTECAQMSAPAALPAIGRERDSLPIKERRSAR